MALTVSGAAAQENYESWALLQSTFESTGGGGIMIKEYNPVIVGNKCVEPPRVCRRPFRLSHAAMAGCSSMA